MKYSVFGILCVLFLVVYGSALTFTLPAEEEACFYIFTEKPNSQISFYFAVQSGGAFDVDYTIKNPRNEIIVSENKERQGDFVLTGDDVGEYGFCFFNKMSTYAEKVIDFEIKYDNAEDAKKYQAQLPDQPQNKPIAHVELMENTANQIDQKLDGLMRTLQYYKTRNNRNQATVRSTESRIYYFSIFEVALMVGMAILQIAIVQLFFKGSRKQLV